MTYHLFKILFIMVVKSDKYSQFAGRIRLNRAITVMYLIKYDKYIKVVHKTSFAQK